MACAALVERGDPDRFAATMAAPVPVRAVLFPLYAFNVEVSRAPWVTAEPMIAEMRLQWWRDVLDEIAEGQGVRRHEVATPLSRVLDADAARRLDALIEARRWDISPQAHEDDAALDAYLDATGGTLLRVAAHALGDTDGRAAQALGRAAGLAAYLRAVPDLQARNRIPLVDGRPEGIVALARRGLSWLDEARAARHAVPRLARPALTAGWLAGPVLKRAIDNPAHVAEGTLRPSEVRVRVRLAWVAATGRF
ncbi:squalene/phytoene synthase family protein [Citreimonas sp.]|uniref:squalene/phytoene synthase family protein n=1 Tax=Citreimonas sp. TaxID=3036715 RepID=UPI0035C7D5F7